MLWKRWSDGLFESGWDVACVSAEIAECENRKAARKANEGSRGGFMGIEFLD
jgi:hypothetical protein